MDMERVKEIGGDLLDTTVIYLEKARVEVNSRCARYEAWQIILVAVGITLLISRFLKWLDHPRLTKKQRVVQSFWRFLKGLPIIKGKVKEEVAKNVKKIGEEMYPNKEGDRFLTELPADGISQKEILSRLESYEATSIADWKNGRVSGCVYGGTEELSSLCSEVYHRFAWTNPLHPDVFPGVRRMEAEVVAMCLKLYNAGPEAGGTMTSGGTESILLAVQTFRDIAFERGIERPEIVVPSTAHAAFDKAGHYFGLRVIKVPNDPKTHTVDVKAMRGKITKNTCLLVASAPSFPYGLIDNVEEVSKLGERYNIHVHVDACLGGFLLPFMEKAGFPLPLFDFRLPGVSSISVDTHKYGYAPKGSSVIMYKDKEIRNFQFFVAPNWSGGIYATPTMAGSRPGALIAGCWATLMKFGENGYVKETKRIIEETRYITEKLKKIDGIFVFGTPLLSVVAVGSHKFDTFRVFVALGKKGWNLNSLQFPASFHLCVTQRHTREVSNALIKDVRECVKEVMKDPGKKAEGAAALYGTAQSIPDRSIITDMARGYLAACYNTAMGDQN
ncbi:Sphingosine-1-phosphate lyase 1 [Holothuria leucospilota]|uniref:sphinganine-1-phosphate aldolase n=1 Tax=Holothuria leucospilota TaxID=206669 RepID=A0A9Q1BF22_HOLLE|nr:Sphingosine-1-phosphate lyase 1 [Holothuria leucospilota]